MRLHQLSFWISAMILITNASETIAQGCSDAGFCTVNGLQPEANVLDKEHANRISLGVFTGGADNDVRVYGTTLEYHRNWSGLFNTTIRWTTLGQRGNDIGVFGPGDVYLTAGYRLGDHIGITGGVKWPLADGGKIRDGVALPMDYQSSLGTTDIVVGLSLEFRGWQLMAGWQQPLTKNNNDFLASDHPNGSVLSTFPSTRNFDRGGDVMLRLAYPLAFSPQFSITPAVLPIWHLRNDRFTDETGVEREIEGSTGLTVNLNLYMDLALNSQHGFQLSAGIPVAVRESRPDGLTRGFVVALEYQYRF